MRPSEIFRIFEDVGFETYCENTSRLELSDEVYEDISDEFKVFPRSELEVGYQTFFLKKPKKSPWNNILITGCGRSGTSCLAGLFDQGKFFLGDKLYPATNSNPKGFYENFEINSINEQIIINSLKCSYGDELASFVLNKYKFGQLWLSKVPQNFYASIDDTLREKMQNITKNRPFCFKDPRFSLTANVWIEEISDIVIICVFRNPATTVESILRECRTSFYLNGFQINVSDAFHIWRQIYTQLIKLYKNYGNILFIRYEDLFINSKIDLLENIVGCSLNRNFPDQSLFRSKPSFSLDSHSNDIYEKLISISESMFGIDKKFKLNFISNYSL